MPEEEFLSSPTHNILTYEEILRIVRVFAAEGISKVRLTGGEPLVRKGIVELVSLLSRFQNQRSQSHHQRHPPQRVLPGT